QEVGKSLVFSPQVPAKAMVPLMPAEDAIWQGGRDPRCAAMWQPPQLKTVEDNNCLALAPVTGHCQIGKSGNVPVRRLIGSVGFGTLGRGQAVLLPRPMPPPRLGQ